MNRLSPKTLREYTLKELGRLVGYGETWMCAARHAGLGMSEDGLRKRKLTLADWNTWRSQNPNFRVRQVKAWKSGPRRVPEK